MSKKSKKQVAVEIVKLAKAVSLDQIADEMMKPLIQWVAEGDGRAGRILNIVNEGLAEKIPFKNVYRWLATDPEKRSSPSAGGMLRMLDAWRKIRGEDVVNVPMPSLYCVANGHEPKRDGLSCKRCD